VGYAMASSPSSPSAAASCEVKARALALLSAGPLPELIVADLDYTLWRCFIDSLGGPPFKVRTRIHDMVLGWWGGRSTTCSAVMAFSGVCV